MRLPVHAVAVSVILGPTHASYRFLAVLTAASVSLWAVPLTGVGEGAVSVAQLPCSLTYTPPASVPQGRELDMAASERLTFPRIASFSPDGSALAVAGDDKTLRVWRLPTDLSVAQLQETPRLAYGSETLSLHLPKRAAVFLWEPTVSKRTLYLLVGDRHGDVRFFPVPEDRVPSPTPLTKGAEAVDMGFFDPSDPLSPRVGHVGMLTDAVFAPLPVPSGYKGTIPPLLLTADRDEHIRISRWGPKRSGWVVEHYVLGSSSFVGAMLVIPYPTGQQRTSALLSADGGTLLRLSDYLPKFPLSSPASPKAASSFLATIELDPRQIEPYVRTDVLPAPARRLLNLPPLSKDASLPSYEERSNIKGTPHLAIVQLALLSTRGEKASHVLLRLEASTALHLLSLSSICSGGHDLTTLDLGRPIVHAAVIDDTVFVSIDTRAQPTPGAPIVYPESDILALRFSPEGILRVIEPTVSGLAPLQASTDNARPSLQALGKHGPSWLDLYPALSSFPKTASDGSAAVADSPEARIRAAMAAGRRAAGREKNLRALFGDQEAGP